MEDLNKFSPGKKEGSIITAKCRLIYPSLFTPTDMKGNTSNTDENKLKYRLGVLVPKGANTEYLKKRVDEVYGEMSKADQEKGRKPYVKTADVNSLAKFADEFPLLLRCNSKFAPGVVGPALQSLQEDECYSGRWGRVTLNPYTYPSIDGGKPGVALGLQNVQYLDHDDVIGGARVQAEDEFEAVTDVDDGDDSGSTADDLLG